MRSFTAAPSRAPAPPRAEPVAKRAPPPRDEAAAQRSAAPRPAFSIADMPLRPPPSGAPLVVQRAELSGNEAPRTDAAARKDSPSRNARSTHPYAAALRAEPAWLFSRSPPNVGALSPARFEQSPIQFMMKSGRTTEKEAHADLRKEKEAHRDSVLAMMAANKMSFGQVTADPDEDVGSVLGQDSDETHNRGMRIRTEHPSGPSVSFASKDRYEVDKEKAKEIQKDESLDGPKKAEKIKEISTPLGRGSGTSGPGMKLFEMGGDLAHLSRSGVENLARPLDPDQVKLLMDLGIESDITRPDEKEYQDEEEYEDAADNHGDEHNQRYRKALTAQNSPFPPDHRLRQEAARRQKESED